MFKEIVGVRPYSFKDDKGVLVEGFTVHLQYPDDETIGVCCENVSIQVKKLGGYVPTIGDNVLVGMNRYGKADFMVKQV